MSLCGAITVTSEPEAPFEVVIDGAASLFRLKESSEFDLITTLIGFGLLGTVLGLG